MYAETEPSNGAIWDEFSEQHLMHILVGYSVDEKMLLTNIATKYL